MALKGQAPFVGACDFYPELYHLLFRHLLNAETP